MTGVQQTSLFAHKEIKNSLSQCRAAVLHVIQQHEDITNAEIAEAIGWPINRVTGRTLELRELAKVVFSRHRQCKITGKRVQAWKATRV